MKAQADSGSQITADLKQALADLEFTLQEATGQFADQIGPSLVEVFQKILPEIAHAALPDLIIEELKPLMAASPEDQLNIRISPENQPAVQQLLRESGDIQAEVIADETLGSGQANIGLSVGEREIDLEVLNGNILAVVNSFFQSLKER